MNARRPDAVARRPSDSAASSARPRRSSVLPAAVVLALLSACGDDKPSAPPGARGGAPAAATTGGGFEERAEAAGITFKMRFLADEQGENFKINLYDHGSAVAVGDYDGDGLDDLYFCNELGSNALYHNLGGGRFEDVTAKSGPLALPDVISVAAAWGDYDADGREDLYVTTTRGGNFLFHNEGGGRFEDVTKKAGLELVAHSQSATWFDANGDGLLDLFVSNTAKWTLDDFASESKHYRGARTLIDLIESAKEPSKLYRNRGDGTFEDVTEAAGLAGPGWSGDTAVFDFDEDGDLDIMVVNMFGASHLYENDGKGAFSDATRRALGRISWGAVGCKAFDYDDDGHLDLLLVDMHSDMTWMDAGYVPNRKDAATKFAGLGGPTSDAKLPPDLQDVIRRLDLKKDEVVFGNTLFHALGGGRFEEVSDRAHLETLWPWGIAAADYDGDGYEDVFLPSGMGYPYNFLGSPLLMNNGDGTFRDATAQAGLDPYPGGEYAPGKIAGRRVARSSRCAANADFDGDGRVDVVVNNFNDRPFLLMNRWPAKSWVGFRLVGAGANRDAIGAVVRLRVGGKTLTRQVHAAGGYLAQSSLALHFGLGDATKVDGAEVTWPGGKKQALEGFTLGKVNRVEQPK